VGECFGRDICLIFCATDATWLLQFPSIPAVFTPKNTAILRLLLQHTCRWIWIVSCLIAIA
jgi:hypothetical protein